MNQDDRPIFLLSKDGDVIARINPETLTRDSVGALPYTIEYKGRTFRRGWTNEGNTDADERLWVEQ